MLRDTSRTWLNSGHRNWLSRVTPLGYLVTNRERVLSRRLDPVVVEQERLERLSAGTSG
jgi:hypothetical protein